MSYISISLVGKVNNAKIEGGMIAVNNRAGESATYRLQFSMTIVTGRKKDGEQYPPTQFWRVTLWGETAERTHKIIRTGSEVFVTGKPQIETYTDQKTGKTGLSLNVKATDIQVTGVDWTQVDSAPAQPEESSEDIPF